MSERAGRLLSRPPLIRPSRQPFVTELDLRLAQLPQSAIYYLRQTMPAVQPGDGEPEYDYEAWLDEVFA